MSSRRKVTIDEIQYKLAHLRNNTTLVIQDSWKGVDDLKQVNADYDTKLQILQDKLEVIQSMSLDKVEYNDDEDEIVGGNVEIVNTSPGGIDNATVASTNVPPKVDVLSKTLNKSLDGSKDQNDDSIFEHDSDNKKVHYEKIATVDEVKTAESTFDSVSNATVSGMQDGSVHDALRRVLVDIIAETEEEKNTHQVGRQTFFRTNSYNRNSNFTFTGTAHKQDENADMTTSFSSGDDNEDDIEEEMALVEQYSRIEGSQVGQKLVERFKKRLQTKKASLSCLRIIVEKQDHEIERLKGQMTTMELKFNTSKKELEVGCLQIESQVSSIYDVDASLQHSCLEFESELERVQTHENVLMQELLEINQKVNRVKMQDTIEIENLQKILQEVNEKRSLSEKDVEDAKAATSTIFHQLQTALQKKLLQNATPEQIQHRKTLIENFNISYHELCEKEKLLAKQLSNGLQHRLETEETLEGIVFVKESLQGLLVSLKEMHFDVSESLIYLQQPSAHDLPFSEDNANGNDEEMKQQEGLSRYKRMISLLPSTKYHTVAATICLENSIYNLTKILSSLSTIEEELQHQLSMLQSGQHPKNITTSQVATTAIFDNTDVLLKAGQVTQQAVQCIADVEDTISSELKELSEKEVLGRSSTSCANTVNTLPRGEECLQSDEIIEELEAELDFENAKLVALKRTTHQDNHIVNALKLDYTALQVFAEKEFTFHLQSLETIQGKVSLLKDTLEKKTIKISSLDEEYLLRREEEKELKQDLDEIKRKAKQRAPCVPMDLSNTVF